MTRAGAALAKRDEVRFVLTQFLAALVTGAEGRDWIELRYRLGAGEQMGQSFYPARSPRRLIGRALALAGSTDVYVGCAPRVRRFGGKDAVAQASVLWADCDGAAAAEALERFSPIPAIVVRSGSGENRHAYWPLTRPAPAAVVEAANRAVAHELGADAASAEAARILRPPGTFNHKASPPRPVLCERLVAARFSVEAVAGELPDPLAPASAGPRADAQDPLLGIAPAAYVSRLLGVDVPRSAKVSCPFHPDRTPSLHVYPTPERGWYCFGCRRGGSLFDLAAALYGYPLRGEGFKELRAQLEREFGVAA